MADQDQISGKVQIDISEAQQALSQIAATLQQTQQTMADGFKGMQRQSSQSTQQIKQDFDKMGTGVVGAIKDMHTQVSSAFTSLSSTITKIGEIAMGVGAILAGGAMFKGVVDKYVDMNLQAKQLSVVMGINVSDAQALIQSFGRVGVGGDTVTSALTRMTRQLKTNEEAFNDNGVKTRDAGGSLLSMNDILFNSIDALKGMEAGTERNLLATTIFGRAVGNMPGFLRMTSATVDEMREHLASLGIAITDVSVAKAQQFQMGMHDVELTFDAIKYKIGEAVIPALINMSKAFAAAGPDIAKFAADAINFFASMVRGAQDLLMEATVAASNIRDAFQGTWEAVSAGAAAVKQRLMETCGTDVVGAFAAGMAAMKGSLQDWKEQAIRDSNEVRFAIMSAQPAIKGPGGGGDPFANAMAAAGQKSQQNAAAETPSGGNKFVAKDDTGKGGGGGSTLLQQWKEELEKIKTEENAYLDFSKQREKEFWQSKLETCRQGSKEYSAVNHEIFTLQRAIDKDDADAHLASLHSQIASERTNWDQKRALMDQAVSYAATKYGADSKTYKGELDKKQALDVAYNKYQQDLAAKQIDDKAKLAQMDLARQEQEVKFEESMGQISASAALARLRALKQQELEIERQALVQKQAIYKDDEKQQELLAQQLATFKQKKLTEEDKALQQSALKNKQTIQNFMAPIESAIQGSIMGIIQGTQTLKKAIQNLTTSVLSSFVGMFAKIAEEWVASKVAMLLSDQDTTQQQIKAQGGVAYMENLVALIPTVGPYAAPVAAGALTTAELALATGLSSAAGGWDVPADSLALIHRKEMVLPASLAENVRAMTSAPGGGQGGSTIHAPISVTINPTQAMTQADYNNHARMIVKALNKEIGRRGQSLGDGRY